MASRSPRKPIVSIQELSKATGISESLLYNQARVGNLPGVRRMGKRIFVHLATFMDYLEHGDSEQAPPAIPNDAADAKPFCSLHQVAFEYRDQWLGLQDPATGKGRYVHRLGGGSHGWCISDQNSGFPTHPNPQATSDERAQYAALVDSLVIDNTASALNRPYKPDRTTFPFADLDQDAPLPAWTLIPEVRNFASEAGTSRYRYFQRYSQREVPTEIADRIQELRAKNWTPQQIERQMKLDSANAARSGVISPPVPSSSSIRSYSTLYDNGQMVPLASVEPAGNFPSSRRRRNTGGLTRLASGGIEASGRYAPARWGLSWYITDENGKSVRHSKTFYGSLEQAEAALQRIVADADRARGNHEEAGDAVPGHVEHRSASLAEYNLGDHESHALTGAVERPFDCAYCGIRHSRQTRLILSVCRPGRRDVAMDVMEYALCSADCIKNLVEKEEESWRFTSLDLNQSKPKTVEENGSLWRRLRGLADGNA